MTKPQASTQTPARYSRLRIVVTRESNQKLVKAFAKSFDKLKDRRKFADPDVVAQG